MKNGCKPFTSPTMDKIRIEPLYPNRLSDINFAVVRLRAANRRGFLLEETMALIRELVDYIFYLYSHIEQLEKDKRYLLRQKYRAMDKKASREGQSK